MTPVRGLPAAVSGSSAALMEAAHRPPDPRIQPSSACLCSSPGRVPARAPARAWACARGGWLGPQEQPAAHKAPAPSQLHAGSAGA